MRVSYLMICFMERELQLLNKDMSIRETLKMAKGTDQASILGLVGPNMTAAGTRVTGKE